MTPERATAMGMDTVTTPAGRTIAVELDEWLDVRVHSLFVQACRQAAAGGVGCIEIDVANTRTVRDSGLAMLMMLRQCACRLGVSVNIINCRPELKSQLRTIRLATGISPQKHPRVVQVDSAQGGTDV